MSITGQSMIDSLDELVEKALLTTYGYREVNDYRGELIIERGRIVSNTLETYKTLERDRSGQSSNPLNEYEEPEVCGLCEQVECNCREELNGDLSEPFPEGSL